MNNREINLRSIIFLFIGILLIISLIVCIYLVSSERDLVAIKSDVVKVVNDSNNKGESDITVSYQVDGKKYNYNFYYSGEVAEGDKIDIYYHKNDISSVQTYKTSYFIFVCPSFGLLLCLLGLVETFRKSDDEDDELYQTQLINIDDKTQQLSIITDDDIIEYEKTPEEKKEPEVNSIQKEVVKEKKKKAATKKITPVYYYLSKDSIVYELKNQEKLEEIKVASIDRVVKEVDKSNNVIREIVFAGNNEYCLNNVKNVNLNRFSGFLYKKLVSVKGSFEEEVEHK